MLSLLSVVRRLMKRECCDPVTVISGKHCSVLPFLPSETPWASRQEVAGRGLTLVKALQPCPGRGWPVWGSGDRDPAVVRRGSRMES